MRGLYKTLFGDRRTLLITADCIIITAIVLATPLRGAAGIVCPGLLLAGAAYLAKR